MDQLASFSLVPQDSLFTSTPSPYMFGNGPNEASSNPNWSAQNWLTSRFHFSFAEYYSGSRSFGVLRVLNDDLVQPKRGFGTHPHSDMCIVTLVTSGSLTHKDSMGTKETLHKGAIQYMSAGTGISHSEFNESNDPLSFLQIWITPRAYGLSPDYGSWSPSSPDESTSLTWRHLVSDRQSGQKTPIKVDQDANLYAGYVKQGHELTFRLEEGRQAYLVCFEGEAIINDETHISAHDGAEIKGPGVFKAKSDSNASFLLVEMVATKDTRF